MSTSQLEGWVGPHLSTTKRKVSGTDTEVCEELRKWRMDVCFLKEVRWRAQGARSMGVKDRRYKLWWSGNSDGTVCVGVLVKEELFEKMVEVRRKSDRVMKVVSSNCN